jgi:hypothetical protein
MLRTLIIGAAVTAGILLGTPTANASPKFCAPHDAGDRYIAACAVGNGGGNHEPGDPCPITKAIKRALGL